MRAAIDYQQEFFNQLTSEDGRTRSVRGHPVRYGFKPSGERNEALDRRVYTLAELYARPVPWEVLLRAAPPNRHHSRRHRREAARPRRLRRRCPRPASRFVRRRAASIIPAYTLG